MEQQEKHQKELQEREKQYDNLLTEALEKVKGKYMEKLKQELEDTNNTFRTQQEAQQAQIEELNKQLEAYKRRPVPVPRERSSINASKTIYPGDKLKTLKKDIFEFVPGTVNLQRGGAVDNTSIDWSEPVIKPKHVTFATSTPMKPTAEDTKDEILALPLDSVAASSAILRQPSSTVDQSTINVLSELRKIKEPRLQKLKGGTTSSAQLFFSGWLKEVRNTIQDRDLSDTEGIQLIREFTESKARQEVDFYMDTNPNQTVGGLVEHLSMAFSSGEDEASIKSEFYSRKQMARESEEDFAEALQLLACKILIVNNKFQSEVNTALVNQFASGLQDDIIRPLARDLVRRQQDIPFIKFRAEVANLSGSRQKKSTVKVASNRVEEEEEDQRPTKRAKTEDIQLSQQIKALMETNKNLASQIEHFTTVTTHQVQGATAQAVGFQQKSYQQKGGGRDQSHVDPTGKPKDGNTYLGKYQEPIPTKGLDGNLNVAENCNYCKNPGHLLENCKKLNDRVKKGLAKPVHQTQKTSGK